jgi:site-specific DNA-methyltransferase (adenine-specific)
MIWNNLNKLVKQNGAICLFGIEPFSSYLRLSNIHEWKYDWIWNKKSFANFLNVKFQPGKIHEIISVFSKGASSFSKNENMIYNPQFEQGKPYEQKSGKQKTENDNSSVRSKINQIITKNDGKRYPVSIIEFNKDKEAFHPTQKPISLMEYLIKTYSNENEYVLDFCAGSGTTGIACLNLNRKCILIEKEEKYCDIIKNRLLNHNQQEFLF